jgi:hypothetical protein
MLTFTGVNKKLLDALKGEDFTEEALRLFIPAFRSLFESCISAELLRSLALFITYALHEGKSPKLNKKKSLRFDSRARQSPISSDRAAKRGLPKSKIGLELLRMYCDYVCSPDDVVTIKRFARAVTNKVGYRQGTFQQWTLTESISGFYISCARTNLKWWFWQPKFLRD